MEKWVEGLKRQEKSVQGPMWKTEGFSTGNGDERSFPHFQHVFPREKAENSRSGQVLSKRGGQGLEGKYERGLSRYFRALILAEISRTVAAKAASRPMRCSTCSMACITVVWSRSPNSLPMSL